jgi:type I restriction enzyme S subunit
MDRAQLLQHFDTLAETPDAVAKLRTFVLDLAVRGRLVPQASKPEKDAAWQKFCRELDERVYNPESPALFEIPDGWRWVVLDAIAEPCGQKKPDKRFTYIDVGAIDNVRGAITPDVQVLDAHEAPSRARKLVRSNSVIYSTVRPYLRNIAVIEKEFDPPAIVSTAFAVLHPKPFLNSRFLFHWLRSAPFQEDVAAKMKGVAYPAISDSEFWECPIPVPPPEEQRRIVAKVGELLALCDELEARQTAVREHRVRIVRSALDHLTAAKDEQDFRKHSAFVLQHSDLILDSVPALRQAILSLAVQGRLVPQDLSEGNATALIERINEAKRKLVQDGRLRKLEMSSAVEEGEPSWQLPPSWLWTRLTDVFDVRDGTHDTPKYVAQGFPLVTSKNLYTGKLDMTDVKFISTEDHTKICERSKVDREDNLFAMIGSIGNPAVVDVEPEFSIKNVALFKYYSRSLSEPRFLHLYLTFAAQRMREVAAGGVQSFVSLGFLRQYPFPLPPLAEQQRIVAKVDELMRWCDALESRLTAAQTTATHLLDATLRQILAT